MGHATPEAHLRGCGLQGLIEAEGHEGIRHPLAGLKGGHLRHGGESQGVPATVAQAETELNAVVATIHGHRQEPLAGVVIHHQFLQGVGVGLIGAQAGHISHPQTQAGGPSLASFLAIAIADRPEAIRPLGITGQEHHMGVHRGSGLSSLGSSGRAGNSSGLTCRAPIRSRARTQDRWHQLLQPAQRSLGLGHLVSSFTCGHVRRHNPPGSARVSTSLPPVA